MAEPIDPRVVELRTRIFAGRITLKDVLKRAGVAPSTWHRWRTGGDARRATLAKVDAAITSILNEMEATGGQ